MYTIGSFGVILNEKKRNLPGGRMEIGESPWNALIRRSKER